MVVLYMEDEYVSSHNLDCYKIDQMTSMEPYLAVYHLHPTNIKTAKRRTF